MSDSNVGADQTSGPQKMQPGTARCPVCDAFVHFQAWQDAVDENERLRGIVDSARNLDPVLIEGIEAAQK